MVFDKIRSTSLFLKASKCEFERDCLKFLGFLISKDGVKADPGYVSGVTEFPAPRSLTQCRRFVGMASYYRRFVPNFAKISRPLNNLTRKGVVFHMGELELQSFESLKRAMSQAPVIAHFNPGFETIIQTDASLFGWGFVISQVNSTTGLEHPVAIESGSFSPAELNYTVTEKEFLAIVHAFRRKRHLLLQVYSIILTDHLNLTYWMEPRELNGRQARWVDLLSGFLFRIVYRPGTQAVLPDALSRRPDYSPEGGDNQAELVQALPKADTTSTTSSTLTYMLRAIVPNDKENNDDEGEDCNSGIISVEDLKEGFSVDPDLETVRSELLSLAVVSESESDSTISPKIVNFCHRLGFDAANAGFDYRGLFRINSRLYVPNHKGLRLGVLKAHHDSVLAGHQGVSKTAELIQRSYCWLGLRRDVESFIRGCAICQRTKPTRQRPQGFLQSLEVSERPWSSISMDFIEELPNSNGFNSILVVVDRLTKWAIFIPTTTRLNTAGLVDLVIDNVVTQHGFPSNVVSDRGSKFTSRLWKATCTALGMKVSLSTAFHPQSDGQTERVNQVLEQYLRVFVNYKQNNWSKLLSRAAFSYNNAEHSATKVSPFFANFGYSAKWVDDLVEPSDEVPPAFEKVKSVIDVHSLCRENITLANEDYAKYYNANRREEPNIEVGDMVLLSLENLATRRPMKKLDVRWGGPYRVEAKVGNMAYRLALPDSMKCHNVFHVSLLRQFHASEFPGQSYEPPLPIDVDESGESYEILGIIDSRLKDGKLEYLVEWLGFEGTDEAVTWEPMANVKGCSELVEAFHAEYPDKPNASTTSRRR